MTKSKDGHDFKIIENLHSDVKEWLKFAESKNAALLTLNAAFLFGILRLIDGNDMISKSAFTIVIISFIFISIGINLISFFPQKVKNRLSTLENYRIVNLLYYSNIAKLCFKSTEEYLAKKYYEDELITDPYFVDLTKQIYSLSAITDRKNTYFKVSLIITIFSFGLLVLNIIF